MRAHHLDVLAGGLSPGAYQAYVQARERIQALMSQWASHIECKMLGELPPRLRMWRTFLAECEDNAEGGNFEHPTVASGAQ